MNKLEEKKQKKAKLERALTRCAQAVQGAAKKKCPVDTGRLRGSIVTEVHEDYALVGTNVEYAPYVEYGTGQSGDTSVAHRQDWKGQAPQPYLVPALKENEDKIRAILKEAVK
jgi:HK97 gp10 family phage protein